MRRFIAAWRHVLVGLIAFLVLAALAHADGTDGTWRLVRRHLPDGTDLTPPAVYGMSTTKNGMNQLIVFWPTPAGTSASISSMSQWKWSDTDVAVTPLVFIFDAGTGKPPVYVIGGDIKRSPVRKEEGRISYQHPIDPPFIVIEGDKLTATLQGAFVDYWERVR